MIVERCLMVITEPDIGKAGIEMLVATREIKIGEMHIIYAPSETVFPPLSETKESIILAKYKIRALKNLEEWCERVESAGIEVKGVEIIFGNVIKHILNVEEAIEPQLIVVAGKKLKKLYGEDLREAIHNSKADVLITKLEKAPSNLFERVMYVHGSLNITDKLINWLSEVGKNNIIALHVIPPILPPEISTKKLREKREIAKSNLDKLREVLMEEGVKMDYVIKVGSLFDNVCEFVEENKPSVLIISGYSDGEDINEVIELTEIPVILLKL